MRLLCRACHGLRWWPRPLRYYRQAICNSPWHPLQSYLRKAGTWGEFDTKRRGVTLAVYNYEVARGIVHTPEYDEWMAEEQARFKAEHGIPGPTTIIAEEAKDE